MNLKYISVFPNILSGFSDNYQNFKDKYQLQTDHEYWLNLMTNRRLEKDYLYDLLRLFNNSYGLHNFLLDNNPRLNKKLENVIMPLLKYIQKEYNDTNYTWIWIIVDGKLEKVNNFLLELEEFVFQQSLPN